MRRLLFVLLITTIPLFIYGQTDSYSKKNRAYITAQEFVKEKLNYPKEASFNSNVVHETDGYGKCIVLGKVVAKNAFGTKTEYTYKIWMAHNGKDWTDNSNWSYSKLILEDTTTKKQQIFDNRTKPKNNTSRRELTAIDGIKCIIIESNDSATRITTSRKMTESQIKRAVSSWKLSTKIIYFHLPNKTNRGQEYASKTGDLILIY